MLRNGCFESVYLHAVYNLTVLLSRIFWGNKIQVIEIELEGLDQLYNVKGIGV